MKGLHDLDFGFIDAAWNKLVQIDKYCRNRKVEVYLIPALRNTDGEADALIADLDKSSAAGAELLRSIGERVAAGLRVEREHISEICQAMDRYCGKLAARLDKEEQTLLPLAHRCLSTEAWFAIAAKLLTDYSGSPDSDAQPLGRASPRGGLTINAH